MFAINHAATALVLKRRFPAVGMWPLLLSVQAAEVFWVALTYLGIEHVVTTPDVVHLGYLPYSHSILSGVLGAVVAWALIRSTTGRRDLALAVGLGIVSHVLLDIITHEPDIALVPWSASPAIGLNLSHWPIAKLLVETSYGVLCWRIFRGRTALLVAIVLLNLVNWPLMVPQAGGGTRIAAHPALLPTVILVQIIVTWLLVWWLAREKTHSLQERV